MNLNEYQEKAMTFAEFKSRDYPFAALAEEAGEVLGKLAKAQRKWQSSQESVLGRITLDRAQLMSQEELKLRADLRKELGDCLWMIQGCASVLGMSLDGIAEENIEKLTDRKRRNVICGEGDNR